MRVLIFTLIVVGLTNGKSLKSINNEKVDPLSNELIDYVNSLNTTWKAGKNLINISNLQRLGGSLKDLSKLSKPKLNINNENVVKINLPDHFDAREAWPNCDSIGMVTDQGDCATCWAVSTVSVMSDRLCIKSNGTVNVNLSAEEVVSCCPDCGMGCVGGGYAHQSFNYWIDNGIVTGGGKLQDEGCYPYEIGPCPEVENGTCVNLDKIQIPVCKTECGSWYNKSYTDDKYYGESAYYLEGVEQTNPMIFINHHHHQLIIFSHSPTILHQSKKTTSTLTITISRCKGVNKAIIVHAS